MAKFNVQECPVCGSNRLFPFITCADYFVSGEQFEICKCAACGMKITTNTEDEENIGKYYRSKEYISHSNTTKGLLNTLYHRVRKYMLSRKRRLVEKETGTKTGHLLDIGAGTGFFLNEMRRHGWKVTGTEKSVGAREFARSGFNLHLLEPGEIFYLKENSFDLITLWHVLEHIHQLNKTMEAIARLLKPEGRLIIALPNHTSYDARHYKQFWAAWDLPRHLWHFGPEQIEQFGNKHEFRLSRMHRMPFDAFYISLLSEKYKKSKGASFKGMFHGKISWLTSLPNKRKCSSVIYVFKKSASNNILKKPQR
jgi:2-polyprenyl-3-methyl-5-hydroxy-6-metoxy-1,4-benzoquinol methylase